jgi:DNA replication protein DnaC
VTSIDFTCSDCSAEVKLEIPDGNSSGARWARALARQQSRCDSCVQALETAEAEGQRLQERLDRRSACRLPKKWRGALLDEVQPLDGQAAALAAARDWATTKRSGGLMLTGDVGVGKTKIAAAACWTRIEQWPCTYASVANAMVSLGEGFSDEGRRAAIRVFAGAGPVVLDDFDKTRVTDYGREQLFAAVDARYQAEAPILVTTNLTPSELGQRYGQAIASRLVEYCRVVQMAGGDRRLQKPALRAAA